MILHKRYVQNKFKVTYKSYIKSKSDDQIKVRKNLMVDLLGIIISDCACTFGTECLDYNYGRAGASLRK